MASWKYDGKIAGNFPWGAVNFDVKKIIFADSTHTYSQSGDETNAVNKIYYIPAGVIPTQANLESFRIWHRYQVNDLVSGTQTVCIEYVPEDDVPLSSLAIFTDDEESSKTVNFGIIHESGLVVYLSTEDDVSGQMTKYNLSGYRRYKSGMSGITLKKGLKYYIQWTNTNNTFKPAYFENTVGNYLNWSHGSFQDKSVANLNSAKTYLGVVSDAATWLAADENDFMISEIGQGGLSNTDAYIRSGTFNNATIIGKNQQTLPAAEKDKLLKLNAGDGFMYIGNNYTESYTNVLENQKIYSKNSTLDNTKYKGLKSTAKGILDDLEQYDYCIYNGTSTSTLSNNVIYKKMQDLDIDSDYTTKGTQSSHDPEDERNIIRLSYNADGNKHIAVNGYMYWDDRTGNVYQLKSGYSYDFNRQSDTDVGFDATTMVSADMVQNRIYYVSTAGNCPAYGNWLGTGLHCWTGSTFSHITDYNSFASYFNVMTFADAVQEVQLNSAVTYFGVLSDLAKTHYDGHYISNNLRGQTVQTDKKFYLEINGSEV